jgi:rhamnogalacturonyl hydrolase YesR
MPIKDLPRSKLYPAEAAMFSKSLLVILQKITNKETLSKLRIALAALIDELEERTGENLQIILTEPVVVRDAKRDQVHGQLVKFVRGQRNHPDPSVAASAVKVYNILLNNDLRLASKAYSVESHKINALLKDLKKEELAGDIEAVNIGGLISNLEQKQREFEEIIQEKVEKKAQSTVKILSEYVTPIRRKIFQILTLIDIMDELEPDNFKTVVAETNALIDEYVMRIRQRESLSEKVSEPQPEAAGN